MARKKMSLLVALVVVLLMVGTGFGRIPSDTFVIAVNTGIFITLDPAVAFEVVPNVVVDALYGKLVRLASIDGILTPTPDLTTHWDISDCGMIYTFYLRRGIQFSDGKPFSAKDVMYSIERFLTIGRQTSWQLEGLGINKDNFSETVVMIDDYTVSFTFDQPIAPNIILGTMASVSHIVNSETVKSYDRNGDWGEWWLTDHSAGAGPYTLARWERNNMVILERNPHFHGGQPHMRRIIFRDVPEASNQRLLLERGDADVAWQLTAQLHEDAIKHPDVYEVILPGHSNEYLSMNASWGPLQNPKVRLAIKYAINYEEIIDDLMLGYALNVQGFVPQGYFGYIAENPFSPDYEKAKSLLKEAGYPDGFEVELLTSTTDTRKMEAEKIQADLAKAGIKANIVVLQAGQMYTIMRAQSHQLLIGGWGNDYPDADNLATSFANYRAGQLAWRCAWEDDFAADLVEAARIEQDPDMRFDMYEELTYYWHDNGPFAMLYQTVNFFAVRKEVKGFEEAADGYHFIFDFTKIHK